MKQSDMNEQLGADQSPNVHFISLTYIRFICSIS